MNSTSVEELATRLANLEREVAALKARLPEVKPETPWYLKIVGVFQDDPEFAEIVRLGREIRRADRPSDG